MGACEFLYAMRRQYLSPFWSSDRKILVCKNSVWHRRTRKDLLEAVWVSMLVSLLKERPALIPTTLLEMLQDKCPGQYPNSFRRTMQRRVREWKLQYGADQEAMFRQRHQPGLRGLSDFTELKDVVVTIADISCITSVWNGPLELDVVCTGW